MPRNRRNPPEIIDQCNCSHSFGQVWSQTQWNRNSRPVRKWLAFYQTCHHCGWQKWLYNRDA